MIRYLSLCSGIEAATTAWHPLGWKAVAYSEIDPFASAVLAHHYPNVPNWGDMTRWKEWPDAAIDVLVGGTPCQSFSVAGLRKGLADPRGNLALTYLAIADRYRPRWIVWENVPGVLSSGRGRDFGAFLGALGELGYGWSYRVLDAQYHGVAQRRRRVFVVGHAGGLTQRAAAVLLERASLRGDPAPRRKAREETAATLAGGARGRGGYSEDDIPKVANCLTRRMHKGINSTLDEGQTPVVVHTLRGEGFDAGEDGTGRGTPLVPIGFNARQDPDAWQDRTGPLDCDGGTQAIAFDTTQVTSPANRSNPKEGDPCHPLTAGAHPPAVAFTASEQANSYAWERDYAPTISAQRPSDTSNIQTGVRIGMQVRRLTTAECARLQGFPDDYLVLKYASAQEAHAAQVLHELWREARTKAPHEQGWRTGIVAALLTPQVLLAGVHGGWLSWEMAADCAAARGALSGEDHHHEGFVQSLRHAAAARHSPYRPESFEQFNRQPGGALPVLSHERASAAEALRAHRLWPHAQARWSLRYAFAAPKEGRTADSLNPDGPRYKALGNSMAVPVMRWIGERIAMVDTIPTQ